MTMITPSYLGETIEYSSLHACRSTLEDPTSAPTHSVNLSWNASTSSGISGYNIYRAVFKTSCGSYAKINSALNTSTLYTDNSVIDGTSYCYASTAVNTSNEESGYSNIISNVQIPTS